jgi:uncharacterized membrane protein YeaQ/YmgE (transglycosylase-associated protein family)
MSVLFPMTVGFGAGVLAWLLMHSYPDRHGFLLTTILGTMAGISTALLGHVAGWFQIGDAEGVAGAGLGAAVVLLVWAALGQRSSHP